MGRQLEGLTMAEPDLVALLTPRQLEVVILIGGRGLSYKAAASQMENKLIKARAGRGQPKISHRTVRQYAREIRDIISSGHSPIRALTVFYYEHKDEIKRRAA